MVKGLMTTIHACAAGRHLQDSIHRDLPRARAAVLDQRRRLVRQRVGATPTTHHPSFHPWDASHRTGVHTRIEI
jgi:hypothetical protein